MQQYNIMTSYCNGFHVILLGPLNEEGKDSWEKAEHLQDNIKADIIEKYAMALTPNAVWSVLNTFRVLSPRANYTDRATAASRRS
jgi:hypothetical protein